MDNKDNEKDFVKDGLENAKIIEIIRKIREVVEVKCNDEIIEKLRKEYSFFAEGVVVTCRRLSRIEG
jgi:uncharacterized protein YeeX (DUF496 family)